MDPVTLILAALVTGAASGAGETTTQAVKDGYAALKALIKRKFAGNAKAEETLDDHEADPGTYEKPLAKQLEATGVAQDPDVVAAAQQVIQAANAAGVKIRYQTNISGGRNVVGEHGRYIENAAPAPGVAGPAESAE